MGRRCTVCTHLDRDQIDEALAVGGKYRAVSKRFSISPAAVGRHAAAHLPLHLARAEDVREIRRIRPPDPMTDPARRLVAVAPWRPGRRPLVLGVERRGLGLLEGSALEFVFASIDGHLRYLLGSGTKRIRTSTTSQPPCRGEETTLNISHCTARHGDRETQQLPTWPAPWPPAMLTFGRRAASRPGLHKTSHSGMLGFAALRRAVSASR